MQRIHPSSVMTTIDLFLNQIYIRCITENLSREDNPNDHISIPNTCISHPQVTYPLQEGQRPFDTNCCKLPQVPVWITQCSDIDVVSIYLTGIALCNLHKIVRFHECFIHLNFLVTQRTVYIKVHLIFLAIGQRYNYCLKMRISCH